jgi:transcriptional regulator with XRE-family HTH domain
MPSNARLVGPLTAALAQRLKDLRGLRGLSQSDVCARTGIARNTYSGLERGERAIDVEQLAKLADVLESPADFILQGAMMDVRHEGRGRDRTSRPSLSPREIRVLQLLPADSGSIADRLRVKPSTVDTYIKRIKLKYLEVGVWIPTKTILLVVAMRDGFVSFDDLFADLPELTRRRR